MVMVEVEALVTFNKIKDLDQSLVQAGAEALQEVLYLENLDAKVVAEFTKEIHILHRMQHVMDVIKKDIRVQCAKHPGRLHSYDHSHTLNLRLCKKYKAHDQNTGKTKNVDIVEMIRSMGLHEHQAKNSMYMQEMSIVHEQY